jgi:hypothetical protein
VRLAPIDPGKRLQRSLAELRVWNGWTMYLQGRSRPATEGKDLISAQQQQRVHDRVVCLDLRVPCRERVAARAPLAGGTATSLARGLCRAVESSLRTALAGVSSAAKWRADHSWCCISSARLPRAATRSGCRLASLAKPGRPIVSGLRRHHHESLFLPIVVQAIDSTATLHSAR